MEKKEKKKQFVLFRKRNERDDDKLANRAGRAERWHDARAPPPIFFNARKMNQYPFQILLNTRQ